MNKIHSPGDIIAERYNIKNYISEGGMQQVFLAWDSHIERDVALKTPKNHSAEKRFQRSAVISAKVIHPNVARTLDYFEYNGREYLIEEYIDGSDLNDLFIAKFTYLDPCAVAHIGHLICKAMNASHKAGIIHRDLKPSNIMVLGNESFRDIKVTDFGIAKMVESLFESDPDNVASSIAGSATLLGAMPYMAPEILLDKAPAGQYSDIWAIGAILYYLLAGKTPFTNQMHTIIISYNDKKSPDPLRQLKSLKHLSELAHQLVDIINSCLNYDYKARPSAGELTTKFENLSYPTKERHIGTVYRRKGDRGFGFICDDISREDIFFHTDEVYGSFPKVGDTVQYSFYSGEPKARAYPIIKIK
jgi:serine/threonine protein kinase